VDGPNHVHVISLAPGAQATLDVAVARDSLPGLEQVSDMAAREDAIAAVNGDYGLFPNRPGHALVIDGTLMQTSPLGTLHGKGVGLVQDGSGAYLGRPRMSITADPASGPSFAIDRWNDGPPKQHSIVAFSAFGGRLEFAPSGVCAARLMPVSGTEQWAPAENGVSDTYTVDARRCGGKPVTSASGIVITSGLDGVTAARIRRLEVGEQVALTWSLGWPGVTDLVGGSPILVEDGSIVVDRCDTYLCQHQPRTAFGITADGTVLLVVIDGRWHGHSVGMTLVQEAAFMKSLGALWALNMDGGGSSTMWVHGRGIVNRPADGSERSVSTAILVLPRGDPSEPLL